MSSNMHYFILTNLELEVIAYRYKKTVKYGESFNYLI